MRLPAVLAIALTVLVLTGCRTADPVVVPAPEPTSTPLFASDEEALAAAEEAYAAYLAVVDTISSEGGMNPERLSSVATAEVVEHEKQGFAETQAHGERSMGSRHFDSMTIQSTESEGGATEVVTYLCLDYAGVDVVDAGGVSVVSPDRRLRYPLVVEFQAAEAQQTLIVANVEDWTGNDFCV